MKGNRFWLIVTGITTVLFWGLLGVDELIRYKEFSGPTISPFILEKYLFMKSGIKFLFYVNLILWFNSIYILRGRAQGVDTETEDFQKGQVKLTLFIFVILIIMEIPIWISVLGAH